MNRCPNYGKPTHSTVTGLCGCTWSQQIRAMERKQKEEYRRERIRAAIQQERLRFLEEMAVN